MNTPSSLHKLLHAPLTLRRRLYYLGITILLLVLATTGGIVIGLRVQKRKDQEIVTAIEKKNQVLLGTQAKRPITDTVAITGEVIGEAGSDLTIHSKSDKTLLIHILPATKITKNSTLTIHDIVIGTKFTTIAHKNADGSYSAISVHNLP
jgi:hypothetical protein